MISQTDRLGLSLLRIGQLCWEFKRWGLYFDLMTWLFSNQSIMIMRSDNYTVLSFFVYFFRSMIKLR